METLDPSKLDREAPERSRVDGVDAVARSKIALEGSDTSSMHPGDSPSDWSSSGGLPGCCHRWAYLGRASVGHPRCDQPNRLGCTVCGEQVIVRCSATRSSKCAPCGRSHRLRLIEVIKSGTTGARFGQYFFVTLTAPGVDVLPWDPGACRHAAEVPCSGKLGCQVDGFDAAVWNGTAPRRWSWFVTYLRRRLGENVQYCGVWEYQLRGVLHRHLLLRVERPTSQRRVMAACRGAARRWEFGSQVDVKAITGDAAREASYLAKYSAKSADAIDGRVVLDVRTGELKEKRGFRPWSCSRSWGESMKAVRERQRAWAVASGRQPAATPGGGAALDNNSDISTIGSMIEVVAPVCSASAALL